MELSSYKDKMPAKIYDILEMRGIAELRPCQVKSIDAGLFRRRNLLVCTPTASGKTLVAEMAALSSLFDNHGKAIYIVPLKALASEKYKDFKQKYAGLFKVAMSVGDTDSSDTHLARYDIILMTSEKLDSLIRHHCPWLQDVGCIIIDEIHLMDDISRGPTLEILITILRKLLPAVHLVALSATIGNPGELASWLGAEPILDTWRPVRLFKGLYREGEVRFFD
ncbi:hypothetical protein COV93_06335 [Candidatus Woesearchaeota archaeon CG11_big_fil_rev_8_21_14_0_20_43_8]|nr:MAG: hypothetical protein COV93_06335 [Candidatus Woesearchaeota archaeon CG11_big_fil_rev_8_21_14_0_20_43_8]PIO04695.1 MAG: hypothetical protein COT47_07950 [Candidatus Woesearchaeota archaeon CG08_land_8_20_14_0_20_43_7]